MKLSYLLLPLALAFLCSCQKPGDISEPPPEPIPPALPPDPARTILLNTREEDANGNLFATLTAFAPEGTVKWKRTGLGTSSNPYLTYNNGVVFTSVSHFEFINGGPGYVSYNNLYAMNAESGNNVWANTRSSDYVYSMVARNDTLFCSIATGSNYYIGAYSASNGALLWKQPISFPYSAQRLTLEGNILYFGSSSSNTENNIVAFDLTRRTIKWNAPIGINMSNVYSYLTINAGSVFVKNGTGGLVALDKATGKALWSKTDQTYEQPVADNNIVYSATDNGLTAFSAASGSTIWQWNSGGSYWFKGGFPFVADNKLYVSGGQQGGFITCFNGATGAVVWKKEGPDVLQYPLVAGDQLFLFRSNGLNPGPSRIMIYDAKTGVARDSITVSGRESGVPSVVTGSGKWVRAY